MSDDLEGLDAWVPEETPRNTYEERLSVYPLFNIAYKNEIDALYAHQSRMLNSYLLFGGGAYTPPPPPARFSRAWWRMKYDLARWSLTAARRRVGLWVGGISPSELECDC